jgi:hypothetical protein
LRLNHMGTDITLDNFQRWMQAVLIHPGTDEEAFASESAQTEISETESQNFVLPSKSLSSRERIGIYREMYFLRLHDAIKMDYEAVCHFMGDDSFRDLIQEYVQAYPSRSFNMNRLSDNLPEYIRSVARIQSRDFLYDLSRLELAIAQIMDAEQSPVLTRDEMADVPIEEWERARLKPIEAFRLLSFQYPVNAYLQSIWSDGPAPKTRRKDSWVVVYRNNYTVWRAELSHPGHDLLEAIVSGMPIGEAIFTIMERFPKRSSNAWSKQLFEWFNDWISDGLFQTVEL